MKRLAAFAVVLFSIGLAAPAFADELGERKALSERVTNLFHAEDFEALEKLAAGFRADKTRFGSGVWKLTMFYAGLDAALPVEVKDDAFWERANAIGERWVQRYPRSPTAHIMRAKILVKHGWKFRGTGYANTVPPAAWPIFQKKVREAREHLERHKEIAARDPAWYELMTTIATVESWSGPQFDALMEEGLQREPLYYQLYFSAILFFLPKWGGDPRKIEAFADAAVKRTHSLEGSSLYARIYWAASQYEYGSRLFTESSVVWTKMKRGIEDVLARYPDQWNINNFAYFSCLAGDRQETKKLMHLISGPPIMQAWQRPDNYARCAAWAS